MMSGVFEYLKIFTIGLLVTLGFYFFFEIPADFLEIPEVKADVATTSLSVTNATPSASGVILNAGSNIDLIEDSATSVSATCTVTDNNGHPDLGTITGRVFRSGVTSTEACTIDGNNCYESTCSTSSCSGSDCVATCDWNIWFIAEPTDTGSDWSGEHWVAWVKVEDSQSATSSATNSAQTIEVNSLTALNVTDSVNYQSLTPGSTNDPLDKTVKATTTGNEAIDANISGTDMCTDYATCTADTVAIGQQHYATSGVAYASGYIASTSAVLLEFTTVKPTATPSDQGQDIYWGISVPTGQAMGSYTGVNTFTAQSDS